VSDQRPRLRDSLAEAVAVAVIGVLAAKALPWVALLLLLGPLAACVF
jgi:hypothetical protein